MLSRFAHLRPPRMIQPRHFATDQPPHVSKPRLFTKYFMRNMAIGTGIGAYYMLGVEVNPLAEPREVFEAFAMMAVDGYYRHIVPASAIGAAVYSLIEKR